MRTNSTLERSVRARSSRLAQHHRDHRRHRGEPSAAIASDRLDVGARGKLRQQHDRGVRRAGELGQRQRIHVIERRRDQIAMALESRAQAASPPPRCGSDATARRPSACRSSPMCRETSPARRGCGATAVERTGIEKRVKALGPACRNAPPEYPAGQSAARAVSQNTSSRAGIAQNEMDGLARKLEVHRHRDEAGAHDAEIGGEIFGAIGRQHARRGRRA